MTKIYKNSSIKNKKLGYYVVLAIVAILAVLLCIEITRVGLVGIFGWAICAYLPVIAVVCILMLSGKTFKVSKGRMAVYVALFVMFVCTLHIMLAKNLINGGGSYILEPIQGYDTVGGVLVSIITAPIKLIFKKFGYLLTFYFICTATLGLIALYPFVANIKDIKRKPKNTNIVKNNPIPSKNSLLVEDIEPKKSAESVAIPPLMVAEINNYKPLVPKERPVLFNEIIGENVVNAVKEQRSASILFGNEQPKKAEENTKESRFQYLDSVKNINTYTNQGRQQLFEDNIKKTFGEQSTEQDYNSRFGNMKVYNPNGTELNFVTNNEEYPLANKTPVSATVTPAQTVTAPNPNYANLFSSIEPNYAANNYARNNSSHLSNGVTDGITSGAYDNNGTSNTKNFGANLGTGSTSGGYGTNFGANNNGINNGSANNKSASDRLYQESAASCQTSPRKDTEELPQSALDRLYTDNRPVSFNIYDDSEPLAQTKTKDANAEYGAAPKKILNPLEYIKTPLRAEEYANYDILRPISAEESANCDVARTIPSSRDSNSMQSTDNFAEKFAEKKMERVAKEALNAQKSTMQQQTIFGTDKTAKPMSKRQPYIAPPLDMLTQYPYANSNFPADYEETKRRIEEALIECNIPAEVFNAIKGPAFTRYEIKLGPGLQPQKVVTQQKLLMMRLCAENMRILAPIKGKDAVGIELPNVQREMVGLSSILGSRDFMAAKNGVYVGFGKDIEGQPIIANIAKMPHLLVAGATGTGKSVFINSLITSILYKYSPEDVRLLLIDPKRVELSVYQNLPNLLIKDTIKEPQHAVNLLMWLCQEMDNRYKFLEQFGCNEIDLYNDSIRDKIREPKMPRIVLVVDEMADLMIKGKGQVEEYIVRIAQLGRACGIHLVLATQRPTVNVITGLIRSNILCRVAFTVKTNQDSRIIFDEGGAENLLGNGDMIYSHGNDMDRIQGAYVDIRDIKKICEFVKLHNEACFDENIANKVITAPPEEETKHNQNERAEIHAAEKDADFEAILKRILRSFILENKASISSAQAKHNVGYIKAKKLVDAMTERGYITKEEGAKPREVLITIEEFNQIYGEE